jgi:hypothetical protein
MVDSESYLATKPILSGVEGTNNQIRYPLSAIRYMLNATLNTPLPRLTTRGAAVETRRNKYDVTPKIGGCP